eukprot:gene25378-33919_t
MDQHRDICNLAEIECPCKMATGCSFRCQRRDMPVHALEHIKGLLNVVQEKQHIIQDLSEAQCKAVVADFYRDCTFHFLSIDTDLSKFDLTKPNIRGRLETILEFIGAPSYDGEVHENEVDCYEPFSHNKQMARNRAVMFSDTDIVSSLARILLKPLAFTEIQLEYTLKVLYSLVWDTSSSHMSWDDSHPQLIKLALTTLGKCLEMFFNTTSDIFDIIPTITNWTPIHLNNEDYMCGVATVMAGFLKVIRLERVLVTDVFKVI